MKRAVVILGVVVFILVISGLASALNIGYVDVESLFYAHPEHERKMAELKDFEESANADYRKQSQTLDEEEIERLGQRLETELEIRKEQAQQSIIDSIKQFVRKVALSQQIDIVLTNINPEVYYGSSDFAFSSPIVDITDSVLTAMCSYETHRLLGSPMFDGEGKWRYIKEGDPSTDNLIFAAILPSTYGDFNTEKELALVYEKGEWNVYVSWGKYLTTYGKGPQQLLFTSFASTSLHRASAGVLHRSLDNYLASWDSERVQEEILAMLNYDSVMISLWINEEEHESGFFEIGGLGETLAPHLDELGLEALRPMIEIKE